MAGEWAESSREMTACGSFRLPITGSLPLLPEVTDRRKLFASFLPDAIIR
jgi:hypothetical protein